jgi:hypothetical protein
LGDIHDWRDISAFKLAFQLGNPAALFSGLRLSSRQCGLRGFQFSFQSRSDVALLLNGDRGFDSVLRMERATEGACHQSSGE